MEPEYVATPEETIVELLKSANRLNNAVPIRRSFLQQDSPEGPVPGPLSILVRHGDRRGLDLYLLLKAIASSPPYDSHRGAGVWARALRHTGVTADERAISKIWTRLEQLGLISRSRYGRLANITLLREDGSGAPYVHPAQEGHPYLKLPVAYWLDNEGRWSETLTLPGKAVLLIAHSLRPGFTLPVEKAPEWYGISADTAQRGLSELVRRGVLKRVRKPKKAPLAPLGFTYDFRYTIQGVLARSPNGDGDA